MALCCRFRPRPEAAPSRSCPPTCYHGLERLSCLMYLTPIVFGRYGLVHGKLLQGLRMWRQNNPAQHAEYGAEHVLQAPHWHVEDSIAVLEAVPGYGSGGAATAGGGGGGRDDAEAGGAAAGGVEDGAGVGAGPEAVLRLLRTLGQGADLEVLCYGNIAREQAQGTG